LAIFDCVVPALEIAQNSLSIGEWRDYLMRLVNPPVSREPELRGRAMSLACVNAGLWPIGNG
jgi:hypothetical protein